MVSATILLAYHISGYATATAPIASVPSREHCAFQNAVSASTSSSPAMIREQETAPGDEDQEPSRPPCIPKTTSLDDAIKYWEKGDEAKGLDLPLKVWIYAYRPSEYRMEAQKLSMINIVRTEFVERCNRDWTIFEQQYPGLRYQYTKLVKAVRAARITRGETKPRQRQRKT